MTDAPPLTFTQFEPLVGNEFRVVSLEEPVFLSLVEVEKRTHGEREGGAFSVLWKGPLEPLLPQQTYAIEHPELGVREYFIVPVAEKTDGYQYEAVFT